MCQGLDLKIQDVYLNASNDKCMSLAAETDKDENIGNTEKSHHKGLVQSERQMPKKSGYWNYSDELSILDGLVLKGTGTVIPSQCKEELLVQFHEVHFSVDRTELRARDSVYWPGINKDIETLVKTCNTHKENS